MIHYLLLTLLGGIVPQLTDGLIPSIKFLTEIKNKEIGSATILFQELPIQFFNKATKIKRLWMKTVL